LRITIPVASARKLAGPTLQETNMSEKELSRALLELDSQRLGGYGNVREQTWKILERDRNRVWWWTAGTFACGGWPSLWFF